jgi:hypothetical protein
VKARDLHRDLDLFRLLVSRNAMSPAYRALVLAKDHVRGCAPFGAMRCAAALGFADEVWVDGDDFLKVIASLPDKEFTAEIRDHALHWECLEDAHEGRAQRVLIRGHLALMTEQLDVPPPVYDHDLSSDPVSEHFGAGLELGSLSCGPIAMRTLGLYGVQIKNVGDRAYAYASDDTTMSGCSLGGPLFTSDGAPGIITLSLNATALLAAVVKRDKTAYLAADNASLYCLTENGGVLATELLLNQADSLRGDIGALLARFAGSQHALRLHRDAVAAFLRRAEALAEQQRDAVVEFSVVDGETRLAFNELTGSTEEYHVVPDSDPDLNIPPVRVDADRIAKALGHADRMVFDYAVSDKILILRGDHDFAFAIFGRRDRE